jgi:hypothetical protein
VTLGQVFSEFFGFPCNRRSLHQLLQNHPHVSYGECTVGQCGRSAGTYRDLGDLNLGDLKKGPNGGVSPTPHKKSSISRIPFQNKGWVENTGLHSECTYLEGDHPLLAILQSAFPRLLPIKMKSWYEDTEYIHMLVPALVVVVRCTACMHAWCGFIVCRLLLELHRLT